MHLLAGIVLSFTGLIPAAIAETWVEIGADPQAKFYVDVDSIEFAKDNLHVNKRGVYTRGLTENLGGKATVFNESRGIVEMNCAQRVNRVIRIDMLDSHGEVVWSSGDMSRQLWLNIKPDSHAESTLEVTCALNHRS